MKANINYKGMNLEDVTMSAVMNYTVSFNIPNERMTTELAQQLTDLGAQITFYTNEVHIIVNKKESKISYKSL
jgi:hypothetical protein